MSDDSTSLLSYDTHFTPEESQILSDDLPRSRQPSLEWAGMREAKDSWRNEVMRVINLEVDHG